VIENSQSFAAPVESPNKSNRHYKRASVDDARRWADKYSKQVSILRIAQDEKVSPDTVSSWLRKLGVQVKQGSHFVQQPPWSIPQDLEKLLALGPAKVLESIEAGIWGSQASPQGVAQLEKFCAFAQLYRAEKGVGAIARNLGLHRSTILEWRNGTDLPYLVKLAQVVISNPTRRGWRLLPLSVEAGGNKQEKWIRVPNKIDRFEDVVEVVEELTPLQDVTAKVTRFGLQQTEFESMRIEMLGYVLGILVGDAGKRGGKQHRVSSMNIDLQLIKSHASNENLGEFVCSCCGLFGLRMHRVKDKSPSGEQLRSLSPNYAYRWISERSPIIGWMFQVCLGLNWSQTTSNDSVQMDWILGSTYDFRKRFLQGLADSDGTARQYSVEIASMPNAEFVTAVLRSIGLSSAYTRFEDNKPTRSIVNMREASALPIFNEFTGGYRYLALKGRV
jgi:transposase-like protein